jgi:hypothetical protein
MTSRAASDKVASLVPLGDRVPEGFFVTTITMKTDPKKSFSPRRQSMNQAEFSQVLFSFGSSFILPLLLLLLWRRRRPPLPPSSFDLGILQDLCTICIGHCCRSRSWNS